MNESTRIKNKNVKKECLELRYFYLDAGKELAEPLVLLTDLEGQLPGVTHNKTRNLKYKSISCRFPKQSNRSIYI